MKEKQPIISKLFLNALWTFFVNKRTIKFIYFIILSSISFGQDNIFYSKSLIDSILADTILGENSYSYNWFKNHVYECARQIEKDKGIPSKMFPYDTYTKAIAYRVNEIDYKLELSHSYDRIKKELRNITLPGKVLSKIISDSILFFINNPLNFMWAECGTPTSNLVIAFYKNNSIIGTIDFACYFQQINCWPENKRTKWGANISNEFYEFLQRHKIYYDTEESYKNHLRRHNNLNEH